MPAAIGVRMAAPQRPVVAVVGDGSSLYQIQSLWTAVHYGIGAVFVVLANGRYAVMDRLAEQHGGKPPWPAFEEVDVAVLAEGPTSSHSPRHAGSQHAPPRPTTRSDGAPYWRRSAELVNGPQHNTGEPVVPPHR